MKTSRAPIVGVFGHIDHGKSTLLDYIRKTNVTESETGGITQRISAYELLHKDQAGKNRKITFLDTPGHQSFVTMRERGALIADIAILVVSAEDGVKAQTIEALKSIRNANLPYIVAINKIDKESANIERTKQTLAENDIYVEGYGGDVPVVMISAKTGKGIDELLDLILLLSDLQDLTGDLEQLASGKVLEAERDKQKGISATLIIKDGTLSSGDFVVAGNSISPVRIFENFKSEKITKGEMGDPVRVIGFDIVPKAGSDWQAFKSKKEAEGFKELFKEYKTAGKNELVEESISPLPLIIKADSVGAIEAVETEARKIRNDRAYWNIIQSSIGDISENDIKSGSGKGNVLVVGFNVKVDGAAKGMAERLGIEIQTFDIIYKLTEFLEKAILTKTPKMKMEEITGTAKILKLFSKTKDKQIMGGRVETGNIIVNEEVRIKRRDAEIGLGKIRELQQAKNKTSQVEEGLEFGTMIESKIEIAPGDIIECFKIVEK